VTFFLLAHNIANSAQERGAQTHHCLRTSDDRCRCSMG
jgi:hypothetical protein